MTPYPYILRLDKAPAGWHYDIEQKENTQEIKKPSYRDDLWIICRIRTHRLHRFRTSTPLNLQCVDAWERYAGTVATSREPRKFGRGQLTPVNSRACSTSRP